MRVRNFMLFSGLLVALLCASAVSAAEGEFKRTLPASANTVVSVNTGAGYIRISPGDGNHVSVTGHARINKRNFRGDAEARLGEILADPPVAREAGRILIGPQDDHRFRNIEIDFDITLPKDASVTANTGAGEIHITGIQSVSSVNSGAGDVVIEGVAAGLRVNTGAGDIRIQGQPVSGWTIQSGAGNVTLEVGKSANYTLSASSGSGGIRVEVPVLIEHTDFGNFHFKGSVNGGGPVVKISTGSGEIRIH